MYCSTIDSFLKLHMYAYVVHMYVMLLIFVVLH